jgi:hypothetical protein
MGDAYKATETKLDREVCHQDSVQRHGARSEILARFEREAKVLAIAQPPPR